MKAPAALASSPEAGASSRAAVINRLGLALALLLPGVVAFALTAPSITDNFQGDDFRLVVENRQRGVEYLVEAFGELLVIYYRPVSALVFFFQQKAFDDSPASWHAVTLLVHAGVAVAITAATAALTRRLAAGLFAGLLFAINPAYGGAVPWISTQTELVAALFSAAALGLFVLALRDSFNTPLYWLSLGVFALALFAKEVGLAVLPAIALYALLRGQEQNEDFISVARRLAPFVIITVAWGAVQFYFRVLEDAPSLGFYHFGSHAWESARYYLLRLAFPVVLDDGIAYDNDRYGIHSFYGWTLVVVQLALFALIAWRGSTAMRVMLVWLMAALAPPSFWEPRFADSRYLYTASLPYVGLIAATIPWLFERLTRRPQLANPAYGAVLLVVALPYIDSTLDQNDRRIEEAEREHEFVRQIEALDLEVTTGTTIFLVDTQWGGFLNSSDFAARMVYGADLAFETLTPGEAGWARLEATPDDYFLGEKDGRLVVLPDIEVEVICEGQPETIRVSNNSDQQVTLESLRALQGGVSGLSLDRVLQPGGTIVFELGPTATSNVIAEHLAFDETRQLQEGVEIQTSHGPFTDLCGSLDLYDRDDPERP